MEQLKRLNRLKLFFIPTPYCPDTVISPEVPKYTLLTPRMAQNPDEDRKIPISAMELPL